MPLHVSSTCAHHQEVKIPLHSLWYHHTYRFDDTRGCVMEFWPPDDEHMCSKHVEAWNKLIVKQKFCASSWLITEINILRCTVSKTSKKISPAGSLVTVSRNLFGRTTQEVYSNNHIHVLSTDQEMIPARNVTDAHAQDFVVNDEFLLTSLKAFAHTAHSFKLCYSKCSMFSVCVQWLNSRSLLPKAAQNSPHPQPAAPAPR